MNSLETILREVESCYVTGHPEAISGVLNTLISPQSMPLLIDEIIAHPEVLKFLSKYSYTHQNGFDKYMLYVSPSLGWKLRLHLWWNENAEADGQYDIHNHAWNYHSYIIAGALTNHLYQWSPESGSGYHHYTYSVDNETLISKLSYCGQADLIPLSTNTLTQGNVYSQHHDALHQIIPKAPICATLFVHDHPFKTQTDVFRKEKAHEYERIGANNTLLSQEASIQRLNNLKNLLNTPLC